MSSNCEATTLTQPAVRNEGGNTVTLVSTTTQQEQHDQLVLRLRSPPQQRPRVRWTEETVDNEGMGKAKSKCCCIYKKPKKWDESSSDEDDGCETGRCFGHVEKRHHPHNDGGPGPSGGSGQTA